MLRRWIIRRPQPRQWPRDTRKPGLCRESNAARYFASERKRYGSGGNEHRYLTRLWQPFCQLNLAFKIK
jgi:hypothetical protein